MVQWLAKQQVVGIWKLRVQRVAQGWVNQWGYLPLLAIASDSAFCKVQVGHESGWLSLGVTASLVPPG